VGFSLQQWDTHSSVFFVFDAGLPSEKKFAKKDIKGFAKKDGSQRDGYVMFKKGDDCCGFKTLDIGTGNGDGFAIDHITFKLGKGAAGGQKTTCKKMISKAQGKKGGYTYCSSYMNKQNPYIAVKSDLECQQICLQTPNCIYATRYKDAGRKFPKKNCHIISLCTKMNHYADNTGYYGDTYQCRPN